MDKLKLQINISLVVLILALFFVFMQVSGDLGKGLDIVEAIGNSATTLILVMFAAVLFGQTNKKLKK